jgi:hypothetical protein
MNKHFKKVIFVSVKSFATAPGTVNGCATVRDFTRRCVRCFRRRTFSALVMNCDFKNHTSSTVTEVGKCTADVLCQLHERYYTVTVFIFECNLSANSKTTHLWIHFKENFFLCFDVENSPLKHFNTPCRKPALTSRTVNPVSIIRTDLLMLLGNNQCQQQGS